MNHLKEIQQQKLEELKQVIDGEALQQYYDTHTYKETAQYYNEAFCCSIKNFKLLLDHFCIKRKGKGYNLSNDREKVKQGMISKYGVDNPQKVAQIKEKTKQTCIEKYGVDNPAKADEVKNLIRYTNLNKYGVENVYQADEIKEKIKQTFMNKYDGAECALQVKAFKEKASNTKLKRYGYTGYHNFEKMKQTNLEKYGRELPYNPDKTKQTCLKRYDVDNISKLRETHIKAAKTRANAIAFDGTTFDSGWEVLVYEYAVQNGYIVETQIPITYNDTQVTFIDFKINGQLYEVKGAHLLNNCWQKKGITIDNKLKCYKDNNVIIITDTDKLKNIDPELTYLDIYKLTF